MTRTIVHLVRHGEVFNPEGILYGRASGYNLSDRGMAMAERVAEAIGDRDITYLVSSPLERAQQTAAPLAKLRGLEPVIDERVIESDNVFAGSPFDIRDSLLRNPRIWRHLVNPYKPSWGEPYKEVAARMWAAIEDARVAAEGHEAVIVSHQLPIWTVRLFAEKRSYLHDPRKRRCTLCSVTSFRFEGDRFVDIDYSEPAADLIPKGQKNDPFSAGTGFEGEPTE